MSKISLLSLLLAGFAMLAASSLADTVFMKDGERIEAKIASETATEMTLKIQVSAGITDERVVKKADVVKVDRVAPDETAYRAIMNFQPGKNSLLPTQYEAMLQKLVEFSTQFPESTHAAEAKRAATSFAAEQKRVEAGEVKVEGLWLTKAEALKQRIQIGGTQTFNAMKAANASGDPIGALNDFAVIEKNFGGSKILPDAVDLARQILVALKPVTELAIENQKVNRAATDKGIAAAGPLDRPEMIAADKREQAKAEAALAAANTGNLWPPFAASNEKCLKAILAKIPTEAQRLEKIPVAPMRQSIKVAEKAQAEFVNKDYAAATETLKEAAKLWPANELVTRLQAAIVAAKNPPKPDPTATPAPGTPASTLAGAATPIVKAATPAPATPARVAAPSAPEAGPASAPAPAENVPEKEPPFFMTIAGAITIVVLLAIVLAGVNVYNKLRHRANDVLE